MLYTSGMEPLEVDEEGRAQLRELGRTPTTSWWVRDRVEMVLLAEKVIGSRAGAVVCRLLLAVSAVSGFVPV